ncbi:MAG: hypothetical protein NWE81_02670, partial [Candidatus Bathyarchaeota archaeon]|nr:hypothetical protein [Candidatus Bathyarchaeota archaeon]
MAACDPALGYQNQDILQHEDHLNDESDSYPHDYTPLEIPFGTDMKIVVAPTITCTSNRNNTWHSHYNACKMAKTFRQDDDWSDRDGNYTYIFEDWIDFDWNDIVVNIHASTIDGIFSDLAVTFREAAWRNPLCLEITAIGTWIRIEWN